MKRNSIATALSLALVPPLLVSGALVIQHLQAAPPVTETVTEVIVRARLAEQPDFGPLKPVPVAQRSAVTVIAGAEKSTTGKTKAKPAEKPAASEPEFDLDDLDLSGLSPELASRVEELMAQPQGASSVAESGADVVRLVGNEADYKGRLPAMNLQTHMYVSEPSNRWIKVNGKEVRQGEMIAPQVRLKEITPRTVVVEFEGQQLEIPALYEWS